jgi:hypothetical protein
MPSTSDSELQSLLASATLEDLERLVHALDRWPRPTRVVVSLELARGHDLRRSELEADIATEIARCASAPLARVARRAMRRPAGDELHEAITESAQRLGVGVRVPPGGTLRGRLAALTGALVDRAVHEMSPAEQQRMGVDVIERIDPRSSAADVARTLALPALHRVLGPAALAKVIEGILVQTSTVFLGRHAARVAAAAVLARVPALAVALGPVAWGSGGILLAWELQKPAFRKLVPVLVCLGFVALRKSERAS